MRHKYIPKIVYLINLLIELILSQFLKITSFKVIWKYICIGLKIIVITLPFHRDWPAHLPLQWLSIAYDVI